MNVIFDRIILYTVITVIVLYFIYKLSAYRERREAEIKAKSFNRKVSSEAEKSEYKAQVRHSVLSMLRMMGCLPEMDDDGSIYVCYQGTEFRIYFNGIYAFVWHMEWLSLKASDPCLDIIREAVNNANYDVQPVMVMTSPDDTGMIYLHSCCALSLHPSCPDALPLLKEALDAFFKDKDRLDYHCGEIMNMREKAEKKRQPIGFYVQPKDENPVAYGQGA